MTPMKGLRVAVIDFETTGVDPATCWPVQVAVGHMELGATKPELVLNQRIRPPVPIPEEAAAVHGIRDQDVADCPTIEDIAESIRSALDGRVIAAYNWPYEHAILNRLVMPGLPFDEALDAFVWAKMPDKYKSGKKLTDVCGRRGIHVNAHDAGGDVLATGEVMPLLLRDLLRGVPGRYGQEGPWLPVSVVEDVQAFLNWQLATAARQDKDFASYMDRVGKGPITTPWADFAKEREV